MSIKNITPYELSYTNGIISIEKELKPQCFILKEVLEYKLMKTAKFGYALTGKLLLEFHLKQKHINL